MIRLTPLMRYRMTGTAERKLCKALEKAIHAIEELEIYKTIGTVDEIVDELNKAMDERKLLERYKKLGSIEEMERRYGKYTL